MDDLWWVLLALGAIFGVPTLAIMAFARSGTNRREIAELRTSLAILQKQVAELRAGEAPAPRAVVEHVSPPKPEPVVVAAPPPEIKVEPPKPAPPPQPVRPQPASAKPKSNLEETVTSSWMVWLGAVAVALAGVFLVKYAIDNELLGPAARVSLGLLLGLVLAIGGEVLRRRPLQRAIAAIRPDYVPASLTASGLFIAFASVYAAYSLYALIPPLVAFALLAVIALIAVGLSLLHGRLVALMGLLGGFVTPALIVTSHPSVWGLFVYLFVVEIACLAVSRYRAWWWLAFVTLAAVILWPFIWIANELWIATDILPLGGYLILSAMAFFAVRWGMEDPAPRSGWTDEIKHFDIAERAVAVAACAIAFTLFAAVDAAGYTTASLVFVGIASAVYLIAGRRIGPYDGLAVVAGMLVLAVVACMPVPTSIAHVSPLVHAPIVPRELTDFATTAGVFAVLFGIGGFVALWGARRPAVWSGVSAGVPVMLLVIAYWRIVDFGADAAWAGVAVALAAVALIAAERVERYRAARGLDVSLGFYAAAVVASLSLAAAMTLREAWLTVALSVQLPALGLISRRVPAQAIRVLAGIVVGVVIVRLALNYEILDYPVAGAFQWIAYGYGLPALACFAAAYLFRKGADDALVIALQAAGLAFAVLLISLEIRLFIAGSLAAQNYTLLEESLQSIAWLAIGTSLSILSARGNRVSRYGARVLLGAAFAQVVLLQLLSSNPMETGEPVGHYPLINVLALAYLVPALFAFRFAMAAEEFPRQKLIAAITGLVLMLAYISFEVRRAYHGPLLAPGAPSDAELYTYSAAWLVYAGVLLTLGFIWRQALLRYAGLGMLLIVSLKVFLVDMGDLTGLYRVASFLGLGLVLIGIGYIYQRFMRPADVAPVE